MLIIQVALLQSIIARQKDAYHMKRVSHRNKSY